MSFYTAPASKFKFDNLPNNQPKSKKAFVTGFVRAIAEAPLSAVEKLAWVKYANNVPPGPGGPPPGAGAPPPGGLGAPGGPEEGAEPVAGPGPGFLPEGAGDEQAIQQLLEALPGNTPEEKLQSAVMALLEAQEGGAGGDGGIEDDGTGIESGDGELDPALVQQLMAMQGPPQGQRPPPGGPPQQPPPGGPPKGPPQG